MCLWGGGVQRTFKVEVRDKWCRDNSAGAAYAELRQAPPNFAELRRDLTRSAVLRRFFVK